MDQGWEGKDGLWDQYSILNKFYSFTGSATALRFPCVAGSYGCRFNPVGLQYGQLGTPTMSLNKKVLLRGLWFGRSRTPFDNDLLCAV